MNPIIDAHIHLDKYDDNERVLVKKMCEANNVTAIISVSMDLNSCLENKRLHQLFSELVYPAYGFHPEQPLPIEESLDHLLHWIASNSEDIVGLGEVGLPTFMRIEAEKRQERFRIEPYAEVLEQFIVLAKKLNKPILLHAVQEEAAIACDLLERHNVANAHFHWYKGPMATTERMMNNGYFISVTPEIVYDPETQSLAGMYPLDKLLVETDGPWPFEGPFSGAITHPGMVKESIKKISQLKRLTEEETAELIFGNAKRLFDL